MERTRNVLLDVFYIPVSAKRAYFYLSCPEEERSITENALVA